MNYYDIAVNIPIKESIYTYAYDRKLESGTLVEVPLGKRKAKGVVLRKIVDSDLKLNLSKVKQILNIIDDAYHLTDLELSLYFWMSQYYHYSLGRLVFESIPKVLKRPRKKEQVTATIKEEPFILTDAQREIFQKIEFNSFHQYLIHGITGSGKSAIYLHAMKKVLDQGKSVQLLLPEINLTPQFLSFFSRFLNCDIYSYHSSVTPSEKYHIWKNVKEANKPTLVIGVRSSLFVPLTNLGLIIVDEEHDSSFKQSDRCPYHARDVAIKKAQLHNSPIILGSATPSLESYHNFKSYAHKTYFSLTQRVGEATLPHIQLLDERGRFSEFDELWPLLPETLSEIQSKLDKKEQVLVFINKLGFSNYIQCRSCGHQFKNERCGCDNNLRYFKDKNILSCSFCEYKEQAPTMCPECGSLTLSNKGFGTEKVQKVLKQHLTHYVIERFDRDEIKTFDELNQKLDRFQSQEIDILVGTQMLSKGHNFKKVNLVILLGIDSMMNYADFRSNEKAYQLIEQISGRSGRFGKEGKVIIQTKRPDDSLFKFIQQHSFDDFYQEELTPRQICSCPPFTKLAMITFSGRFRDKLVHTISEVSQQLRASTQKHFQTVQVLGPAPLAIEKRANQFSWALMLKSENINELHNVISTFEKNYEPVSSVSYKIDVDAQQIL